MIASMMFIVFCLSVVGLAVTPARSNTDRIMIKIYLVFMSTAMVTLLIIFT